MDHKEAINILTGLIDRKVLKGKEKEAVLTAIGVLSWTYLSQNRVREKKAKRDAMSEGPPKVNHYKNRR